MNIDPTRTMYVQLRCECNYANDNRNSDEIFNLMLLKIKSTLDVRS